MNASGTELLTELRCRGIELRIDGEDLCYRPRSALTPDLAQRVRSLKAELMALLSVSRYPLSSSPTSAAFTFVNGQMSFGDVCKGWTPTSWAQELRRKADRCDTYQPDMADYYRRWAEDIERRLEEQA